MSKWDRMVQKMCFAERKYGFFFFLLSRYQCSIYLPLLSRPGRIKHQTAVLFRQSFFPIVLLLCTYLYFFLFFLIRDWCVEGSFLQQQKGISVTTVVESKPESSSRKRRSSCSREDSHLSSGNFPLSILLSWDGHYSGRKEMQGYCSILRARWENLIQNMYWWVLSLLNSTSFRREGPFASDFYCPQQLWTNCSWNLLQVFQQAKC